MTARLLAISDLHVNHPDNRRVVDGLYPQDPGDHLIVAGDVCETVHDVIDTLATLRSRFARVIWCPGNHELWTPPHDPCDLRGVGRYDHLVDALREIDVVTPEDPYPVFDAPSGPVRIAPLMTLYDYSFRPRGGAEELPLSDVAILHPDPYPGMAAWCHARVELSRKRLQETADPDIPFVLVNHYPLVQDPVDAVRLQGIAPWCGTRLTETWHRQFPVSAMVYGHLHIRRNMLIDRVHFSEVSLGYPREWKRRTGDLGPVSIHLEPR